MKVAIYTYSSPESLRIKELIIQGLKQYRIQYDEQTPDIVISIGGDGTLLSAFSKYQDQLDTIRFVGIHTGHLGFYTDWRKFEVNDLVASLRNGTGQSISYPLLDMTAKFSDGQVLHKIALNESTIKNITKTMVCDVYINHELFERFRGDGLCVSTPTGSTAYNKAVGGAVMDPHIIGFQLAEMASLNNRVFRTLGSPTIFGSENVLTLRLADESSVVLTCDRDKWVLDSPSHHLVELTFKVSDKKIRFAKYRHTNFWQRVRESFIGDL
ncbi:NAD kinase [Limosilactobacillus caecicola]|uniref:NAD kinase n=1 Tax=Limosilactobacillus caecicola TaxID=2941332 RepID=UPI00203BCE69|nr:NAD kinase [Limosilactobacillus caecicola]